MPTEPHIQALHAEVQRLALGASFDLPGGARLEGPLAAIEFHLAPDEELRVRIRPTGPPPGSNPAGLSRAAAALEALTHDGSAARRALARSQQRRLTAPRVSDDDLAGCRLTVRLNGVDWDAETGPGGTAVFGRVPHGRCQVVAVRFGEAVATFAERLSDPSPQVQRQALTDVRRAGQTAQHRDGIRRLLAGSTDEAVRLCALETLAETGTDLDAVAALLEGPTSARLTSATLAALARRGRPPEERWITWLLERLEDADADVRRSAAAALVGCRDALPRLIGGLSDADAGVRAEAAAAIVAAGADALPLLAARLDDPSAALRRCAAEAVGRSTQPAARDPVEALARLLGDADASVVRASLEALGRLGDRAAAVPVGAVTSLMRHPDRGVKGAAARAYAQLSRTRTPVGVSAVSSLLRDPDRTVRQAARDALARIDHDPLLAGPFPLPFAGRFEILGVLGQGGMATVFHARRTDGGGEVALKLARPFLEDSDEGRRRFREEARVGGRLCHPNCCRVLEYVEGPGRSFIVLPFMAGGSLEDRLARGPMEPREAARIVACLAEALHHAHGLGYVHNDVKPSNVLFAGDEPVLGDFGVALDLTDPDARLPGLGDLIGTLPYLAPELVDRPADQQIGPQCDSWALGVVLFQLLTGCHPFHGRIASDSERGAVARAIRWTMDEADAGAALMLDLLAAVATVDPGPPSAVAAAVPAALDEVCRGALTKRPADRLTAGEVAARLRSYLAGEAPTAPPAPLAEGDIKIDFVPYARRVPDEVRAALYLDVGGAVRPGVLDHHQLHHYPGSTAAMVPSRLHLIDAAVRPGEPFTLYLHEHPDFDALASAYLARRHLTRRELPPGTSALCSYTDRIDAGHPGFRRDQPFTPYAAFRALLARAGRGPDGWRQAVELGFAMLDHVLAAAPRDEAELLAVDAFAAPGLFTAADRSFLTDDRERYRRKLADPRCMVRRATMHLVSQTESRREACPALLIRNVCDEDDADRCLLVKDWARADGVVALCVFFRWRPRGSAELANRAILSVTADSGVSLRGLGAMLEREEGRRREALFGRDDRRAEGRPDRPGYANPDPWYDGRSHDYTIVDGPAGGSVLSADEVERIFLEFGEATR